MNFYDYDTSLKKQAAGIISNGGSSVPGADLDFGGSKAKSFDTPLDFGSNSKPALGEYQPTDYTTSGYTPNAFTASEPVTAPVSNGPTPTMLPAPTPAVNTRKQVMETPTQAFPDQTPDAQPQPQAPIGTAAPAPIAPNPVTDPYVAPVPAPAPAPTAFTQPVTQPVVTEGMDTPSLTTPAMPAANTAPTPAPVAPQPAPAPVAPTPVAPQPDVPATGSEIGNYTKRDGSVVVQYEGAPDQVFADQNAYTQASTLSATTPHTRLDTRTGQRMAPAYAQAQDARLAELGINAPSVSEPTQIVDARTAQAAQARQAQADSDRASVAKGIANSPITAKAAAASNAYTKSAGLESMIELQRAKAKARDLTVASREKAKASKKLSEKPDYKKHVKVLKKESKYTEFDIQGANSMDQALSLYLQAKMLAKPNKGYLKSKSLSSAGFENSVDRIEDKTNRNSPQFNFSDIAPSVNLNTAGGAAAGATLGAAGFADSPLTGILGILLGGATGGTIGNLKAKHDRKNMMNTSKVLKDYGLLNPEKFHKAAPLLRDF